MSRQRLTKFLIISVCWMVINVHGFTVAAEPVARVVGVEGVVSVIRKDNALLVTRGEALFKSDQITTEENASIELKLLDGSLINLGELADLTIMELVFDPIKKAGSSFLMQMAGSIGGSFGGSLFGGSSSGGYESSAPMEFASGGFAHAGKPALVGEKGAEIFMPRVGGQIIPNDQLGGGGVNVTLNLSTGVSQTVRSEVMGLMPLITSNVKNAVQEARLRGGSFSEAMGV